MDVACPKCHAQHWIAERIGTSRTNPRFNFCCSDGAVNPPPQMMMAWNSNQDYAVQFREHARRYNNALAFTSVNYLSDSRGGYRPFQIQSRVSRVRSYMNQLGMGGLGSEGLEYHRYQVLSVSLTVRDRVIRVRRVRSYMNRSTRIPHVSRMLPWSSCNSIPYLARRT
jgi:hypothetical protein